LRYNGRVLLLTRCMYEQISEISQSE
jgi:hypothetical protein